MRSFALCLGLAVLAAGCGSAAGVDIPGPPPAAPFDPSAPADAASDTAETPLSTGVDPSLVAPHPIAPASGATVTSTRPTLAWVVPAGLTGARVQICGDRACESVEREIEVTGDAARPRRPLAAGVHFYRLFGLGAAGHGTLASAAIPFTVRHRGASVDTSWGSTPDVDGDGRADLALTSQANPPRIALHTAVGEPTIVEAAAASAGASYWIANAGDVDGDGFTDVLLGIPGERVDVYRGSPRTGLVLGWSLTSAAPGFGSQGTGLGDVDRDGYADVAVLEGDHAVLYRGTSTGLVRGPSIASTAKVAPAGDVNGDGYADVLAVRTGARPTVAILAGSATGVSPWPIVTLASPSEDDVAAASFGWCVARAF